MQYHIDDCEYFIYGLANQAQTLTKIHLAITRVRGVAGLTHHCVFRHEGLLVTGVVHKVFPMGSMRGGSHSHPGCAAAGSDRRGGIEVMSHRPRCALF